MLCCAVLLCAVLICAVLRFGHCAELYCGYALSFTIIDLPIYTHTFSLFLFVYLLAAYSFSDLTLRGKEIKKTRNSYNRYLQ